MSFLSNSWFVGIVTGIVSGIIVYFITKYLFERRDNAEYIKKVSRANQDVINNLKPYIVEEGLPDIKIFISLIDSCARENAVKPIDMYKPEVFCQEMIKEIIADVYVSNDKKKEYSNELIKYINNLNKIDQQKCLESVSNYLNSFSFSDKKQNRMMNTISIVTALLTGLSIFVLVYGAINGADEIVVAVDNSFIRSFIMTLSFLLSAILIFNIADMVKDDFKQKKNVNKRKR